MLSLTHPKRQMPKVALLILFGFLCMLLLSSPAGAEGDGTVDELLPPVGSALVEAGQSRWDAAAADVEVFAALWRTANTGTPDPALAGPAAAVDAALADAAKALAAGGGEPAKTALSTLARSVDAYVTAASGTVGGDTGAAGRETAAKLARGGTHAGCGAQRRLERGSGSVPRHRQRMEAGGAQHPGGRFRRLQPAGDANKPAADCAAG